MSSGDSVIFCFLLLISHIAGLVKLPNVDDNNILHAEAVIRDTVNTLFTSLRLKDVKKKPRLKEYSTVHNHLISFTLQDYNNLKEIAKLTKVVKNETNVDIDNFMTTLNDLLNEDSTENVEFTLNSKEEILVNYIEDFLHQLEVLKFKHGVKHDDFRLKEDISRILKKGDSLFSNNSIPEARHNESVDQDNILDDEGFWNIELQYSAHQILFITCLLEPENISSGRRIYHGNRVKIKHFPFVASIHIFNSFQCAGSIISADLIVTAASCLQLAYNNRLFQENPAFLSIRVGSDFYNGGEHISALEVYFHPLYSPKNLNNNICLIRLSRKLSFSKRKRNIKKIEFDKEASMLPEVSDGITIVGWGAKGAATSELNPWRNRLTFAVLDYYPLTECQESYSKEYVTRKNFCAGFFSKGGGACNRDVGGPGVVNGILAGVISFGSPVCGSPNSPTVFTKVGYHTDWIETIMEQDVPERAKRTTTPRTRVFTIPNLGQTRNSFKITPPSGNISPIPIRVIDSLRTLNNTDIFKEYIITMFDSKERKQYEDFLNPEVPISDQQIRMTTRWSQATRKHPHQVQTVTPIYPKIPTAMSDYDPKDVPAFYDIGDSLEKTSRKPENIDPELHDIGESLEKYTINPAKSDPVPYYIGESLEKYTIKPTSDPVPHNIRDSLERDTLKPANDDPGPYDFGGSLEKYSMKPEKEDSELNDLQDSLERTTIKPVEDVPDLYGGDSFERNTFKPTHSVTGNYDIGDSFERNIFKPTDSVTGNYDIGDSLERNTFKPTDSVTGTYDIGDSFERNTFKPTDSVTGTYDIGGSFERNTFKPTHSVTGNYDIGDSLERNIITPAKDDPGLYDMEDSIERNTFKPNHDFTENYDVGDSLERDTFKPSKPSRPSKPSKPSTPSKPSRPSRPSKMSTTINIRPFRPSKPFKPYHDYPVTVNYDIGDSFERSTKKPPHVDPNDGKQDNSKIKPDESCSDETDVELIRMLNDIDVDKLIDNISNLDDNDLVVDPKILELLQNYDDENKVSNIDESLLTLLYLSDNERDLLKKDHNKKQIYMDEEMAVPEVPFKDLTYRNNNSAVMYNFIPENDLYNLMSNNMQAGNKRV